MSKYSRSLMAVISAVMCTFFVPTWAAAQLTWVHLDPSGTPPSPRSCTHAVYVSGEFGAMCIFGGAVTNNGPLLDDMYMLTLPYGHETWGPIPQQGSWPSARARFVLVFDSSRRRIFGFGGADGYYHVAGDNWTFALDSLRWVRIDTSSGYLSPSPRVGADYAYDSSTNKQYLFGGTALQNGWFNDVWCLDLATGTWQQLSPNGTPPIASQGGVGIVDRANNRFIFFAGQTSNLNFTNETWAIGPLGSTQIRFTQLSPSGTPPPPMRHPVAVYDSSGQRMIVFGGEDNNWQLYNTVWQLTLTPGSETWQTLTPGGTPPPPMYLSSSVLDVPNRRMVVFGGDLFSRRSNDVYALEGLWSGAEEAGKESLTRNSRVVSVRPNPSAGPVTIAYELNKPSPVRLGIFDVTGKLVRSLGEGSASAGSHQIVWDGLMEGGGSCRSGVYFYELAADGKAFTGRIIRTR